MHMLSDWERVTTERMSNELSARVLALVAVILFILLLSKVQFRKQQVTLP